MKTIEKGMYVRTKWGQIGKILSIDASLDVTDIDNPKTEMSIMVDTHYYFEDEYDSYFLEEIVGEPSFNIMDLIEKGDLVELTSEYCKDEIYRVIGTDGECIALDCFGDGFMCVSKNKDIKRVLTKEYFTSGAYEVKRDKNEK